MSQQTVEQLGFDFLPQISVVVQPSRGRLSSDAGLLPLVQWDRRLDYTARMADCLNQPDPDPRQTRKPFSPEQRRFMLRQRLFGILAGYEDCNDHDTLRGDPVLKMAAGRMPEGDDLFSQPSLSRFENSVTPACLFRLIDFVIQTGIEQLKRIHGGQLPASITLDLDATDDPTHGQQQFSFYHGYFEQHQYFPLIISEPTTKHVFLAWLRPGTVHAALGADDDLMRVVRALRKERPDIRIHVRGDAGFGMPWMYQVCEDNDLSYTFGFSTNSRLRTLTAELMQRAVTEYEQTKVKQRLFLCLHYQCESWDRPRPVVAKAECHAAGTNLRFVVTNLPAAPSPADWPSDPVAREVYDDYTMRGESEQRMDELKNGLWADRLSCHRFMANFFRLLVHTAAFNLFNAFRQSPDLPQALRTAQPQTWRTQVIKVAAVVIQSVRRVVVKLAANWPWWNLYVAAGRRALAACGVGAGRPFGVAKCGVSCGGP